MKISVAVFYALACTIAPRANAFDPAQYQLSTIDAVYRGSKAIPHSVAANYSNPIVLQVKSFSITGKYLDSSRTVDSIGGAIISNYGSLLNINIGNAYQHELLFQDTDGRACWLPIQETHWDALKNEYFDGCRVTLYLILLNERKGEPFVIINEFRIDEPDTSYLKRGANLTRVNATNLQYTFVNAAAGKAVRTITKGTVTRISNNPYNRYGIGAFIEIEHQHQLNALATKTTYYSVYGLLKDIMVHEGQQVAGNDTLARTAPLPDSKGFYDGGFLFGIYSKKPETLLESWTNSRPFKVADVCWYSSATVFKKQRNSKTSSRKP